MKFDILIIGEDINPKLLSTLKANRSFIRSIFSTTNISIPNSFIINPSTNIAETINKMLAKASTHTIWLKASSNPDEELFEEYADLLQQTPFNLIYPNYITKKGIKNFHNWENKNIELLQTFNIEKEIPQWGIYYKNDSSLDPSMKEFAYYDKLFCNLKNMNLTLADTIFIEEEMEKFPDQSYKSKTLRKIVKIYDFQKELFTHLDWKQENIALATAYTFIGNALFELHDYFNASLFFQKALKNFHNRLSAQNLLRSYIQMGLFEDAKSLAKTELDREVKEWIDQINNFQRLVVELEARVNKGLLENLEKLKQELFELYDGALLYNLYGVVEFIKQNFIEAYNYFYQAAYRNPIDPDILQNISIVAKKLNKETEVIDLYERITK